MNAMFSNSMKLTLEWITKKKYKLKENKEKEYVFFSFKKGRSENSNNVLPKKENKKWNGKKGPNKGNSEQQHHTKKAIFDDTKLLSLV